MLGRRHDPSAVLAYSDVQALWQAARQQSQQRATRWALAGYTGQFTQQRRTGWALSAFNAARKLRTIWSLFATPRFQPLITATTYTLVLTGADDALDDLALPMSSFQSRLRTDGENYLSVVIPNAGEYIDGIAARPNGDLVISRGVRYTDGAVTVTEILRVNLETIRDDRGTPTWSATLTGHKSASVGTPKTVALMGVTYRAQYSGARHLRADLDNTLRPGDTATWGDDSFTVGEISFTVSPALAVMEVAEAAA